ncbi:VOC family protein [Alteromonas sp. KUL49]|uniref:VOC family protein n=1 Tax=Alteromonas sp. KUL49 TaxID=2480798 RepID=UPI00102EDEB9|nr:VOC family protein [Alteromonas sp. KUL49]TAP40283.1 VOC family protein [Alteromonas sp. KUL49]GEA11423.1 hypothetical protein KUL49_17980 [Alteromonas sp. KUL49]
MSENTWIDITTDNATELANFYQRVMGWTCDAVNMGDYSDFVMLNSEGEPVGGICHRKGPNKDLPSGWIPYFVVSDLDYALIEVSQCGGMQHSEIRYHGKAAFVIIKDVSGSFCALYDKAYVDEED